MRYDICPGSIARLTDATIPGNRGSINFDGTDVKIVLTGGTYTTDNSSCQGIRAENYLYQTAGNIDITVSNPDARAIYTKSSTRDKWEGGTRNIH